MEKMTEDQEICLEEFLEGCNLLRKNKGSVLYLEKDQVYGLINDRQPRTVSLSFLPPAMDEADLPLLEQSWDWKSRCSCGKRSCRHVYGVMLSFASEVERNPEVLEKVRRGEVLGENTPGYSIL